MLLLAGSRSALRFVVGYNFFLLLEEVFNWMSFIFHNELLVDYHVFFCCQRSFLFVLNLIKNKLVYYSFCLRQYFVLKLYLSGVW